MAEVRVDVLARVRQGAHPRRPRVDRFARVAVPCPQARVREVRSVAERLDRRG